MKIAKRKKTISLPATKVAEMIKDLSVVVVSLDRIGSSFYDDPKQREVELAKFFDSKVFKRLSGTRGTLSEAFNSQSAKSDITRLEDEAESLPYWQHKKS
jgi:hypothetical protein